MKPFREEVRKFAHAMEYKLAANDHKGGWEESPIPKILSRLRMEVEELAQAIEDGNDIDIILEAADVANYAMMAAHNARLRDENSRQDAGGEREAVDDSNNIAYRESGGAFVLGGDAGRGNSQESRVAFTNRGPSDS